MAVVNYETGIANEGNWSRLKQVMKRAQAGEPVTIGFLGGSITQGSLSSLPSTCYAYLVYEWWQKKFPAAKITYVNAGIGGTTSQFGVARVAEDLLTQKPDVVVVEFSVNDENTPFFQETYEGLVRRICTAKQNPAVILLHNIFYATGDTAQEQHEQVGRHYDLPCLSMRDSVYQAMKNGLFTQKEITPDGLHPNDLGHQLLAGFVIYFLEKIHTSNREEEPLWPAGYPKPLTRNAYECSIRYRNHNCQPICQGFVKDTQEQAQITEIFRKGWIGEKVGDSICFEVEGSGVAVQYRKSVKQPACTAVAVVDGREEDAILLDGNFEEDWGDCLYLQSLVTHGEYKMHKVEITVKDGKVGETVPFYLVSVIVSKEVQDK